jgi:hypothetical protein
MERLKELITQLREQFDRKAEPDQMLETTRLLEAELRLLASQPSAPARVTPTKIAVMMPSSAKIVAAQPSQRPPVPEPKKDPVLAPVAAPSAIPMTPAASTQPTAPVVAQTSPIVLTATQPAAATQSVPAVAAVAQAVPMNGAAAITLKAVPERGQWPFDPLAEKPTDRFTLSQRSREVNDVIGNNGASSLNDKLKTDVVDLKSTLNDSPVRDLKKAIGINDRYVFINQLFRGDEVMYERSLKTINGFRILPEAEYWMERELKVKLGWDENRETTRHFYQLVKRRFS